MSTLRHALKSVGVKVQTLYHVEYDHSFGHNYLDLFAYSEEDAAIQTHMQADDLNLAVRITSIQPTVMN